MQGNSGPLHGPSAQHAARLGSPSRSRSATQAAGWELNGNAATAWQMNTPGPQACRQGKARPALLRFGTSVLWACRLSRAWVAQLLQPGRLQGLPISAMPHD